MSKDPTVVDNGTKFLRAIKRFCEKSQIVYNGCWEWTGYVAPNGYARSWDGEKQISGHRYSYLIFVGDIPPGFEIDHLCRNRKCVNPFHLEAVTSRENKLRGDGWSGRNARKQYCLHGHLLAGENVYDFPNPPPNARWRACKICRSVADKKYKEKVRNAKR